MRLAILSMVMVLAPCSAAGQVRPTSGPGDPHIQSVDYHPDQVVLIQTAPGYQVTIDFAPDEQIENVAIGDSSAWHATPNKRGDRLFVKLVQANSTTDMVVVTDSRQYVFELRPAYGPLPDMAYTIHFNYPGTAQAAGLAEQQTPVQRSRYRLSGKRSIRPSAVEDDGAKTYLHWPADATLPAIYTVDRAGQETLVNGMMRDGVFVIDSVAPSLVFRLDQQIARAERIVRK